MASIDPVWQISGIALVIGFLIGTVIQMLLKRKAGDAEKLKAELEQARAEMEQYKASVNRHFNKTSDLVNELTQDYVKVYQHLAEGAQNLSDTPVFAQMLEQSQGRVLISVEDDSEEKGSQAEAVVDAVVEPDDRPFESVVADTVEADRAEADKVDTDRAEATGDDGVKAAEAGKPATKTAAADKAGDDARRDPAIGDSPQPAEADSAPAAEADSVKKA